MSVHEFRSSLRIYDTLRQGKREFHPLRPGEIRLYVCGVTVYDLCHIGHARTFTAFDSLVRYLRHVGYRVTYVRNITDVDDKILARAAREGRDPQALARAMTAEMHKDFQSLGLLDPDVEPKATEHIAEMQQLIERLLEVGKAYVSSNGDVCFRVRAFEGYGELSGQRLDGLVAGARVSLAATKESPADFVLWKRVPEAEAPLSWDSPWGRGRPGWHIECSAMSRKWLGCEFDLHGGGLDLKFPHHENERAQSVCSSKTPFARYWLHTGMVTINEEKMSKSLNNFLTIRTLLDTIPAQVLRVFFLLAHYRSPLGFSEANLNLAQQSLNRWYGALLDLELRDVYPSSPWGDRFHAAMHDDFNTPKAFAALFGLASQVYASKAAQEFEKAAQQASELRALGRTLGLFEGQTPQEYFRGQVDSEDQLAEILRVLDQRQQARAKKDWAKADQLRAQLSVMNIQLEDRADGTHWSVSKTLDLSKLAR